MGWGEEEKNKIRVLSHEGLVYGCQKEIKGDLPFSVLTTVICFIVGLLAMLLIIWGASGDLVSFEEHPVIYVGMLLFIIVGVAAVWWPAVVCILDLVEDWSVYRRLRDRKYTVVDDIVVAASSSEVYPQSFWECMRKMERRYETPHYATLYFSRSGRHPVSRMTYENSEKGDRFFVILIDGKKPKVYGIYSQKFYRWEGEPTPIRAEP
ncbi:MAG: MerC domain-containing protein [Ruminococcaceae bacterium]|nr:MerC domain-containing protein [Oscillospiraceae bacterium]